MADAKGSYIGGAPVLFKDVAARAMISDEYNPAKTYTKGGLCIRNGKVYKAVKETTGDWDATAWEATSLTQIQAENAEAISALNASKATIIISQITINGTGGLVSNVSFDKKYKLLNIIASYEGSVQGKYRITSIMQVNDNDYVVFLSNVLNTGSYIYAYAVLMEL